MEMSLEQEQEFLFKEWNKLCDKMRLLNECVQNDLQRLINDGYTTSNQIKESINELEILYIQNTSDLENAKNNMVNFMNKFVRKTKIKK